MNERPLTLRQSYRVPFSGKRPSRPGTLAAAVFVAALAASLGACETLNQEMIGRVPYVNESGTAPMRPGYMNLNGCQIGTHGVPYPNGNGFMCRLNNR